MKSQSTTKILSVNGNNILCDVSASVVESECGNASWRRIKFDAPITIMADEDLVICDPTHGESHG